MRSSIRRHSQKSCKPLLFVIAYGSASCFWFKYRKSVQDCVEMFDKSRPTSKKLPSVRGNTVLIGLMLPKKKMQKHRTRTCCRFQDCVFVSPLQSYLISCFDIVFSCGTILLSGLLENCPCSLGIINIMMGGDE